VIFHDEEADPNFILDNDGNFVANSEPNNQLYAENAGNLGRFGRVVAAYDGLDNQPLGEDFFSLGGAPGTNGAISLEVFVDMDQDGDVDLVDFDRDGRLDIVDVDQDGRMDVIDGRANYVDVRSLASVPVSAGATNGISGLGVLDYVAVTGVGFSQQSANITGENWSNERVLVSQDLLAEYNDTSSNETDFVSLVSDFATANGGRGGDAYTQTGYSIGDISVATGDNDLGEATSLVIATNIADGVPSISDDILRAQIGHGAFQSSDSGGVYVPYRAGREGLTGDTDVHVPADGADAGNFPVNGNGGRGGNASGIQGQIRDLNTSLEATNFENDHLVGAIYVNTPNLLDESISSDAGQISITSTTGSIDSGENTLVSQIGHNSIVNASADNMGGVGASAPGGEDGSSQTENADGGDGGDASVLQRRIKGEIFVMTGSDDLDGGPGDFSLELTAGNTDPSGGDNIVISQIGHGRLANAIGGAGGDGDDAQFRGNGGNGGDATVTQEAIIDTGITIDLVDVPNSYDGNGLLVSATSLSGSTDIIRSQIGHGDIASALGGDAGNGTPEFNVNEQRNQTANGGQGGNAVVNQAGYNYDITIDAGANEDGDDAVQILSSAAATTNGAEDHILAAVGHGGIGFALSGAGGDGGLNGAVTGIPNEPELNLVDGDFFGVTQQGDTVGAIDTDNRIVLGTTRRGGNAGDAIVNLNIDGTGQIIAGRAGAANDVGIDDTNGAVLMVVRAFNQAFQRRFPMVMVAMVVLQSQQLLLFMVMYQ